MDSMYTFDFGGSHSIVETCSTPAGPFCDTQPKLAPKLVTFPFFRRSHHDNGVC